ncbi:TetR/AcrR family transcriptional regulator [Actinocatenispora sera]|uniref:TetR family transcriptional regulator n=1 Tax=Actinocatenispora sera TaxID=390989 RepID=A0A810KZU5_9ACTN|nr:TetR/AcrR family transcriptional regulator [Actinocatenispora sera]BCJ28703.1 TetR family transcriptional regulator [Actinocatenispora sera]
MPDTTPRKRQARGERRAASILDAAAEVFTEAGYERASTNAIAARAGISPGSLYQFFANKQAIAEALSERHIAALRAAHAAAFTDEASTLPVPQLVRQLARPIVEFNLANPSFQTLLADTGTPHASAKQPLHDALLARLDALFAARCADAPAAERHRHARVAVQLFTAMLPLVLAATEAERPAMITELEAVLVGYLQPLLD